MIALLLIPFLLWCTPVLATTYYVSISTGSDSNSGTSSGSRFRTLKKAAQSASPGDTILVGNGTYTAADQTPARTDIALYISSGQGVRAGSAGNPITLKSENYGGAVIKIPSINGGSAAINVSQPYWVIEGFDINGTGITQSTGASASQAGITISASNTTIKRNKIWNIATTMCNDTAFGQSGILLNNNVQNTRIEYNRISNIGRLRFGESGCGFDKWHHDHGIYAAGDDFTTIRYNVFFKIDRGYAVHVYASGSIHDNISITQNTFDNGSPDTRVGGMLILCNTLTNITLKNNIFRNPAHGYAVEWCSGTTASNLQVKNNVSNTQDESGTVDLLNPAVMPSSGVTSSGNLFNKTLGLANTTSGAEDFTLTTSSQAIDVGADLGSPYNGSAPDAGAFETFTFSSCTVTAVTKIQATFTNNLNPPLLPTTGITTFTARKNAANNVLSGLPITVGDNIIEITTTNSYAGGDTVDISWASGNITDSSKVGGTLNQPYIGSLSNQSCTNNLTGGGPTYTLTQAAFEWHDVYGTEASPTILPLGFASTGEAENLSLVYPVYAGSKWRTRFAIVCGVSACPDDAYILKYSLNGGSYTTIPDTAGADGISFCGVISTDPANGSATTNQLSTAGTFRTGGMVFTSNAIPTITSMASGNKTENEYCLKLNSSATGTFAFRVYTQNGTALNTYTATPQVVVGTPAFGAP